MTDSTVVLQIGIDCSDRFHCFYGRSCLDDTQIRGVFLQRQHDLQVWIEKLRAQFPQGRIQICLEVRDGPLVEFLCTFDFLEIYPINPAAANSFRKGLYPSGAKDDPSDAQMLWEYLNKHGDRLRRLRVHCVQTRRLDALTRQRRRFVQQRTQAIQALQAVLKLYYPQAIGLFQDWSKPIALKFLRKWPDPASFAKARSSTLRRFFYANRCRSGSLMDQRMQIHSDTTSSCADEVTLHTGKLQLEAYLGIIESLNQTVQTYDEQIQNCYQQHPQKALFDSFPGAGEVLAPRLATVLNAYTDYCHNAQDLAVYTGVAPIRKKSGKSCSIAKRLHLPAFLHQTMVEFAQWSLRYSKWAQAYYRHRKDVLKQSHNSILRTLAFKWIRILFKCWQTNTPYDEDRYIENLRKRGSWIAQNL